MATINLSRTWKWGCKGAIVKPKSLGSSATFQKEDEGKDKMMMRVYNIVKIEYPFSTFPSRPLPFIASINSIYHAKEGIPARITYSHPHILLILQYFDTCLDSRSQQSDQASAKGTPL